MVSDFLSRSEVDFFSGEKDECVYVTRQLQTREANSMARELVREELLCCASSRNMSDCCGERAV